MSKHATTGPLVIRWRAVITLTVGVLAGIALGSSFTLQLFMMNGMR